MRVTESLCRGGARCGMVTEYARHSQAGLIGRANEEFSALHRRAITRIGPACSPRLESGMDGKLN